MAKTQPVHLLSIFKISLHNLKQHRVRSALALLGLIVGIAALITTVSIGRGAAEQIRQQILSLGNNFILIKSETFLKEGKIKGVAKEPVPLDTSDYFAIKAEAPHITAMTPVIDKTVDVSYDANRLKAYLKGTNGNIFKIYNRKISSGVPFSNFQVDSGERVAVLGYRTAKELFSEKAPLGKTILIQKVPFIVIGVLEELKLQTGIFSDQNLDIFVPYTAVNRLDSERSLDLSYILLSASEKKDIPGLEKFITRLLRFRHDIREGMPEDFTILDQQAFLNRAKEPMKALSLFLTLASTIAMTVGGIGLMNTLLVSITERHREIGLRMAIGASPAAILLQYLFESIILCLIGGIAGVILGIVVSKIVSHVTNFPVIIEPLAILSGVITAVLIGIFFGLYPAWTASKLNPVDSLKVGN